MNTIQMNIVSYKDFDLSHLEIKNSEVLYKEQPFYLKTPIIESSGILEKNGSNYIYLNFYDTKNHDSFLHIIKQLDKRIENVNFENKAIMSSKYKFIMKIDINSLEDTFFNKTDDSILPIEIRGDTKCICLLKYDIDNNSIFLFQYMKL